MFILIIVLLILVVAALAVRVWALSKPKSGAETPGAPRSEGTETKKTPSSLPESSLRDEVTGLYNYKHLYQRLDEIVARADRENKQVAIILWDIDGFMDFNNRYGKKEGDVFLTKVATSVKKSLRVYDEAFRSGADEFCAILVPADEVIAEEVKRRVSEMVSKELFQGDAEYAGREFSISSGHVFYPGENKVPEALLHAARQALYKSRLTNSSAV